MRADWYSLKYSGIRVAFDDKIIDTMLPPRTRSQARLVWVPQKWTLLNPRCLKGNGHPHAGGEGYTPASPQERLEPATWAPR